MLMGSRHRAQGARKTRAIITLHKNVRGLSTVAKAMMGKEAQEAGGNGH